MDCTWGEVVTVALTSADVGRSVRWLLCIGSDGSEVGLSEATVAGSVVAIGISRPLQPGNNKIAATHTIKRFICSPQFLRKV